MILVCIFNVVYFLFIIILLYLFEIESYWAQAGLEFKR